ncbi:MAG TPA: helix-turn-helix domain-containing protein [Blastocatellia bacterium]|nr:helix-turn-helix domain-containing protein [Blastocatellia bacterium]
MEPRFITTAEAAERLGVHRTRINVLIREGRLPAKLFGKVYLIEEEKLALVSDRKPGRPPKAESAKPAKKAARKKGK